MCLKCGTKKPLADFYSSHGKYLDSNCKVCGDKTGTITIDRETGEVCVRAKGSRRVYRMMLGSLATMVCIADLKTVVRDSK